MAVVWHSVAGTEATRDGAVDPVDNLRRLPNSSERA